MLVKGITPPLCLLTNGHGTYSFSVTPLLPNPRRSSYVCGGLYLEVI